MVPAEGLVHTNVTMSHRPRELLLVAANTVSRMLSTSGFKLGSWLASSDTTSTVLAVCHHCHISFRYM